MNLDSLEGRWLKSDYPLVNLARMVREVTRVQYNSITQSTNVSCIDHVYTNAKYRCSQVTDTSFGSSDHDMIGYIRYSKELVLPRP